MLGYYYDTKGMLTIRGLGLNGEGDNPLADADKITDTGSITKNTNTDSTSGSTTTKQKTGDDDTNGDKPIVVNPWKYFLFVGAFIFGAYVAKMTKKR